MISWTRPRMLKGIKVHNKALCHWTPASNTHQASRGKRNQYWLMLCPGSIRYILPWRWNKRRESAKEEMRRRERWGTFRRPMLLPIVIRQLPILPLLHNADVLSHYDLSLMDLVVLSHLPWGNCRNNYLFQSDSHIAFNHARIVQVPWITITTHKVTKVEFSLVQRGNEELFFVYFFNKVIGAITAGDQHEWHLKGTAWLLQDICSTSH